MFVSWNDPKRMFPFHLQRRSDICYGNYKLPVVDKPHTAIYFPEARTKFSVFSQYIHCTNLYPLLLNRWETCRRKKLLKSFFLSRSFFWSSDVFRIHLYYPKNKEPSFPVLLFICLNWNDFALGVGDRWKWNEFDERSICRLTTYQYLIVMVHLIFLLSKCN